MKVVHVALGLIFLGLAGLGVILPLLPTTPFLLLAVFFFAKGSPRMKQKVLDHRIFGAYLRDYYNGTMPRGQKIRVLTLLWVGILFSAYLLGQVWTWIVLPLIALGVTIHILTLKPKADIPPEYRSDPRPNRPQ